MPNVGLTEILILLAIALMVVGPSKLPDLGRSLGRAIREFRNASATAQKELGLDEVAEDVRGLRDEVKKAKDTVNVRKQLGLDDIAPLDLDADLEKGTSAKTATTEDPGSASKETAAAEDSRDGASGKAAATDEAATEAAQAETPAKARKPRTSSRAKKTGTGDEVASS